MGRDRRRSLIAWFTRAAQLWHIAVVLAVLVGLQVLTGLRGPWLVVYPAALVLIAGIGYAVYDREGGTVLKRSETRHGNDMHGHY